MPCHSFNRLHSRSTVNADSLPFDMIPAERRRRTCVAGERNFRLRESQSSGALRPLRCHGRAHRSRRNQRHAHRSFYPMLRDTRVSTPSRTQWQGWAFLDHVGMGMDHFERRHSLRFFRNDALVPRHNRGELDLSSQLACSARTRSDVTHVLIRTAILIPPSDPRPDFTDDRRCSRSRYGGDANRELFPIRTRCSRSAHD